MDKSVQYRVWWKSDDVSELHRMGEVMEMKWQDNSVEQVTAEFPNEGIKTLQKSEFDLMMSSPYTDINDCLIFENDIFIDGRGNTRIILLGHFRKWDADFGVGNSAHGWHTELLSNIDITEAQRRKSKCIALYSSYASKFRIIGNLYQQDTEYSFNDD